MKLILMAPINTNKYKYMLQNTNFCIEIIEKCSY